MLIVYRVHVSIWQLLKFMSKNTQIFLPYQVGQREYDFGQEYFVVVMICSLSIKIEAFGMGDALISV